MEAGRNRPRQARPAQESVRGTSTTCKRSPDRAGVASKTRTSLTYTCATTRLIRCIGAMASARARRMCEHVCSLRQGTRTTTGIANTTHRRKGARRPPSRRSWQSGLLPTNWIRSLNAPTCERVDLRRLGLGAYLAPCGQPSQADIKREIEERKLNSKYDRSGGAHTATRHRRELAHRLRMSSEQAAAAEPVADADNRTKCGNMSLFRTMRASCRNGRTTSKNSYCYNATMIFSLCL